jgi:hypothetical protein
MTAGQWVALLAAMMVELVVVTLADWMDVLMDD